MPKCGTRTFVWTVFSLHQIRYFGPPVNVDYMLGNNKEDKMKNQLLSYMRGASPGAIVHGHYRYIPFYRPERKPVYMSMIRDPVGRFESFFYFMRHGDQDMSREQVLASLGKHRAGPDETLDDCVEKNRSDCSDFLNMNIYVTSFCGYRLKCSQDPKYAFKRAKRNIEKFLVVGLVEDYDLTLRVFEKLLPATFGEAANIYSDAKARFLARSKTSYKKTSKPSTYAVLKKRMKYDYMFYEYVKQRFYNVAGRLGLGPCAEPSRITHDPT
ncbi:uronyl 2-sulfotransferase-like [Diadema antillarum]|uniref:uronyl 2-sulfotransferase-like n=1 Tax=Diadema antillarum TaxID=105358 RepID=UPI003A8C05DB